MKRLLVLLFFVTLASPSALAAEDGLRAFLSHLDQPWAQFFVIGATVSAVPLVILLVLMFRGLFNQNRFYPRPGDERAGR
ncbi:MAG: hypothetical protein GX161_07830 [Firmicutes bacterium]|jgi:hypothetical protein|nr:hypothetical protein [Bacillota bacterium]